MSASISGNTLGDVTNTLANTSLNGVDGTAKEWSAPEKYDYKLYNASTREEREAAEKEAKQRDAMGGATTEDVPAWAASAARYEWSDDFGDIGPRDEKLEKILFHGAHINRRGMEFGR